MAFNILYKSSPHIQGKSGTPTTLISLSIIVVGTALISYFHLHLNFFSHIVCIIDNLLTALTSSYFYNVCNLFTKWTVGRKYLDSVMLFARLALSKCATVHLISVEQVFHLFNVLIVLWKNAAVG
jgi:hypothetical protein